MNRERRRHKFGSCKGVCMHSMYLHQADEKINKMVIDIFFIPTSIATTSVSNHCISSGIYVYFSYVKQFEEFTIFFLVSCGAAAEATVTISSPHSSVANGANSLIGSSRCRFKYSNKRLEMPIQIEARNATANSLTGNSRCHCKQFSRSISICTQFDWLQDTTALNNFIQMPIVRIAAQDANANSLSMSYRCQIKSF